MKKEIRKKVYEKFYGHCAYCGKTITLAEMQVDHLIPKRLVETGKVSKEIVENENNYMPACRRCNHYKRGNSLEVFRAMIYEIPNRLYRDSYIFKVGANFGNVVANYCMPIKFYFEKVKDGVELITDCELYERFRAEITNMYVPEILKECQVIRITDDETEIGIMCVNDGYIDCLYILPEYRKQGHGKKAVLSYIEKYGMLRDLHILNTNHIAKAFWENIFELEPIEFNSIDTYYKIKALKGGVQE